LFVVQLLFLVFWVFCVSFVMYFCCLRMYFGARRFVWVCFLYACGMCQGLYRVSCIV
jgi:hypothetical protein